MYETHWTGLSGPCWERKWTFCFFATTYRATGRALRTSTAKPTACTVDCELLLHNGNFLGITASDVWRMDTAVLLAQNGLADTGLRCFPTEITFDTRATTVCGVLGRSARPQPRRGYIWCDFWTTRGRSTFLFLRALHDFDRSGTTFFAPTSTLS